MPQFYPDGPTTVTLNAIQENGGINTPPQEDFDTPALQGSMQQILSENLGKFVIADFLVGVATIVRRAGVIYSVGRGYVTLYLAQYNAFEVCDVFSLKFVTFFPPGSEPSIEDLNRGLANSGILLPGGFERAFGSGNYTGAGVGLGTMGQNMNTGNQSMNMNSGNQNMNSGVSGRGNSGFYGNSGGSGSVGPSGCRTLGQR